jgi:hypothetical protein
MNTDFGLDVVTNKKTGQLFVFVEESSGINIKVINPDGNELTVPSIIFDPKQKITAVEMQSKLTEAQIKAINSQKPKRKRASSSSSSSTKTGTTRRRKTSKKASKVGLGAEWNSGSLTFYKHKIEPLEPKQWFIINVEGHGKVRMTRDEFNAEFTDVILLEEYWKNGSYSYPEFPEKAKKFIVAES